MRRETPARFERRPSLFPDDQEGEHDVFQKRETGLVDGQRKLLRVRLRDKPAFALIVQLRKQISLCVVSTGGCGNRSGS